MGPPGHFAVALAVKPTVPRVPLWLLLLVSEVLDLLAFGFMALNIERGAPDPWFPFSHGLFMSIVWSTSAGMIVYPFFRNVRTSFAIGCLVFSHWALDFISHEPDLPLLFKGSPLVGLGLESSILVGLIMELSMFAGGIAIYLVWRKRQTKDQSVA
jgi:hypothetical protein